VFGHLGDRVGRKETLIVTLMLLGGCTMLVGVLPTYSQVGVLAPVRLIPLRLTQGIAMGGELAHLLGYGKGEAKLVDSTNYRNGTSRKRVAIDDDLL
jgi:MFS family permease